MPELAEAAETTFVEPPEDATDHQVAEGIRDGKFASPQKYGDFWLFDLRITGTGMAYRDSIEEWAHRNPETWLTDEFVARCNGLPVIFGHPERSGLNSKEFQERAIGSIVLPYIKGDEVWGVAKIFDADSALLMQTTHRSTSPGVTPPKGSSPVLLEQGTEAQDMGTEAQSVKVLDEGLPLILDHLAVCEAGVWDKDGPPDGIRLDALSRKDASVTEEEKKKLEEERDDAKRRADAAETKLDAFEKADAARKDAEESDKEAIEAAEKGKADKAKKDAADAKKDARKDRHDKHDGDIMDCARCDSEESEEAERDDKAKKDAAAAAKTPVDADRGTEIKDSKRVTDLEAMLKRQGEQIAAMTAQPSIEDSNEIAKAWGRWDSLYQSLGDQTPQAYPGEKPRAYLRRLADGVRKYTDSWKSYAFHDSQQAADFGLVADAIFAEALAHAKKPSTGAPGVMREIVTHPHGKTRTEFIGDSRTAFAPFMPPRKAAVVSIRNPHTGNVYGN